jgi:sarcosine oxidase subunit alpha
LASDATEVSFSLDGERLSGHASDTLASALLRRGVTTFTRSIKYHRPRGPFCFAGSCGQCLVRVDGVPSVPACRVQLREGMSCERQNAPAGADTDFFRAVDFLFPGGLDHHHLMVQSRLLGRVALEVARRLSGLGTLPKLTRAAVPGGTREVQIAVIGAGPAGLAAAQEALRAGARVLVLERDAQAGGAALLGLGSSGPAPDAAAVAEEVLLDAEVVGLYPAQGDALPLLAVREGARLTALRAERVIVATGGTSQPFPFSGVDRPGVYAARGLVALSLRNRLLVGMGRGPARSAADGPSRLAGDPATPEGDPRGAPRLAVLGTGRELLDCARALRRQGYALARVVDAGDTEDAIDPGDPGVAGLPVVRGKPLRARGNPVVELQIEAGGAVDKIRCDAVALAFPQAPLHDLASSVGASAPFQARLNGFAIETSEGGRTRVPWLYAAGTAAGAGGARAQASGAAAGRSAAQDLLGARAAAQDPGAARTAASFRDPGEGA